ncbi:hypothetical protein LX36DRAFT_232109 [Colletotrichum falcatum]|nr:hypothetical protein LX36DRAFT_232109 [Colletotrichum falcatum]
MLDGYLPTKTTATYQRARCVAQPRPSSRGPSPGSHLERNPSTGTKTDGQSDARQGGPKTRETLTFRFRPRDSLDAIVGVLVRRSAGWFGPLAEFNVICALQPPAQPPARDGPSGPGRASSGLSNFSSSLQHLHTAQRDDGTPAAWKLGWKQKEERDAGITRDARQAGLGTRSVTGQGLALLYGYPLFSLSLSLSLSVILPA